MEKNDFLKLVKEILCNHNFTKVKNSYYLNCDENVIAVVGLQKSYYGEYYYIEYGFCVKSTNEFMPYPKIQQSDIRKRIVFNLNGDTPDQVLYESIDPVAFQNVMSNVLENEILPAVGNAKDYIKKNIGRYIPVMKRKAIDELDLNDVIGDITVI